MIEWHRGGRAHIVQQHQVALVREVALDAELQRGRGMRVDQGQHVQACKCRWSQDLGNQQSIGRGDLLLGMLVCIAPTRPTHSFHSHYAVKILL